MTNRKFYAEREKTKRIGPDCASCRKRDSCEEAREGYFCAMWQSREPEIKGPDPNEQWRGGEDADF